MLAAMTPATVPEAPEGVITGLITWLPDSVTYLPPAEHTHTLRTLVSLQYITLQTLQCSSTHDFND
jgi:hypothetical protein